MHRRMHENDDDFHDGPSWLGGLGVHCPQGQADGFPCFELRADCEGCDKAVTVEITRTRPFRPLVMESLAPDHR